MILAKPLKRKGLQAPEPTKDTAKPTPHYLRDNTESPTEKLRIDNPVTMKGELFTKVVHFVVDNTGGINSCHVDDLVREFCRLNRIKYTYSSSNVSATLKALCDRGKIKRIQYEGVYYYFPARF